MNEKIKIKNDKPQHVTWSVGLGNTRSSTDDARGTQKSPGTWL